MPVICMRRLVGVGGSVCNSNVREASVMSGSCDVSGASVVSATSNVSVTGNKAWGIVEYVRAR